MPRSIAVAFVSIALSSCMAEGQVSRVEYNRVPLEPYDDACSIADLCEFRGALLRAIDARDRSEVVAALSTNFNPGGVDSRQDFLEALADSRSVTWLELGRLLRLGGSVGKSGQGQTMFCAPYRYTGDLRAADKLVSDVGSDGYIAIVTAPEAPVHATASVQSAKLGTVGHELVAIATEVNWRDEQADDRWVGIYWRGQIGYVSRRFLWSANDPRLCLTKEGDSWKLTEFRDPSGNVR